MNISFTYQAGGRRGEGKLARCGQIIRLQKKGNSKTNRLLGYVVLLKLRDEMSR